MANTIVSAVTFNAENIMYTKPKANNSGGKSVGITNKSTKKALRLQTPVMLTWGANVYENEGKDNSYDFALQFPRDDFKSDDTDASLKNLSDFEAKIKADALSNSKEWFGKNISSAEVIDALWTPMLKYPKDQESGEPDKSRPPVVKVKMPYWEGSFNFELYDVSGNQLFPDENGEGEPESVLTKGSNISCVMQCGGIWFANGKFGVTWRLVQAIVKPKESLKGKCHISLSSEEKKTLAADTTPNSDDETNNVEDSDGEEVESPTQKTQVSEEPSSPEPAPKKKKVVRSKKKEATATE